MADAVTKLAKQRLSMLELAETLGNISEACWRRGLSRNQYYEYKRWYTTLPEMAERIAELALQHPTYGCNHFEALLKAEGHGVSSVTIKKVLSEHELGSRYQRWLALERRQVEAAIEFTSEQAAFIEKQNPCFRERHVESTHPGELLPTDTFYVGQLKDVKQGLSAHRGRHSRQVRLRLSVPVEAADGTSGVTVAVGAPNHESQNVRALSCRYF